jgi:UDP-N-acetylmuramoyl-L-alanine---L-glutamate ligase
VRFSQLEGLRIGVWGAGREIRSLAAQLARRLPSAHIAVAVFDGEAPANAAEALCSPEVRVVGAGAAVPELSRCHVVVRSPGVSTYRPELRALGAAGVKVTTATSLWLAERGGRGVIGVTGTKGKSTTAALIFHLANAAGRSAALAGNIGVPALDLLERPEAAPAVVELSSYQIADLEAGPQVALITNLFREHLDWHGSEEAYRADKLRLLALEGVRAAVVSGRDERLVRAARDAQEQGVSISLFGVPDGWQPAGSTVELRGVPALERSQLPLRGEHNALNLCAALAALEAFGVPLPQIAPALRGFETLPHRLQTVLERDGAAWVDDSISTTPESALAALAAFPASPVVLIAGGQDRGQDYSRLAQELAERGASVIGVPSTGPRLVAEARSAGVPAQHALLAGGLEEAVAIARGLVQPGGAVLLSPAAPSYDSFRDFEERGERFQELAASVPQSAGKALNDL